MEQGMGTHGALHDATLDVSMGEGTNPSCGSLKVGPSRTFSFRLPITVNSQRDTLCEGDGAKAPIE